MNTLNVGLGTYVASDRVIAIVSPESAPIKRLICEAKDGGTAIDSTYGRRTRSVIIMDNGQIVLSSLQPTTIAAKGSPKQTKKDQEEE